MLTDKEQEEIRRKLLGLEEEQPAGSWSKIAAEIQSSPPPAKTNWWLPAILLLLLVVAGIFYFTGTEADVENAMLKDKQEQVQKQGAAALATSEEKSTETEDKGSLPTSAEQLSQNEKLATEHASSFKANKRSGTVNAVTRKGSRQATGKKSRVEKTVVPISMIKQKNDKNEETAGKENYKQLATIEKDSADAVTPVNSMLQSENTTPVANLHAQTDDSLLAVSRIDSTVQAETVAPETDEVKKAGNWYLGVTLATRYAFRYFEPAGADEIYITSLNKRKNLDPNRLGYEFGLTAGRSLKENLYLETNLAIMKLREQVAYSYTSGKVDTLLKTKTSDGSYLVKPVYETAERELKSDFIYGGLRVGLTYFFLSRPQSRFNVTVAAGANLLVKGRTEEYLNGVYSETIVFPSEENLLEQTNYNLLLGAGYNLSFHKKYELMVMPSLNYFLGSTYAKREPFGLKPYTMGISFQVRRML